MAASVKSIGAARLTGRSRPTPAPDLMLPPRRRIYVEAPDAVPGALPAYAWLAAGLVLAAGCVIFLLWLALAVSRALGV